MTCPCEDKCTGKLPPKAIEIVKECGPVLFHKVPYPASLGVPTDEELRALQYKNVLLEVEANGYVYLYSSDGVPTLISKGDIDPTEILEAVSKLQQSLAAETSAREEGDTNLQEQLTGLSNMVYDTITTDVNNLSEKVDGIEVPKLPASMVYDFVSPAGSNNPSTEDNAKITARVVNTTTGAISSSALMMPMASETQAGSITAADKSKLNSLLPIQSLGTGLELSDGELLTDAPNMAQVRSATVGDVLYSGTGAEATITLTSPVSQYEKVEIIGSWAMPHTDVATPLQVIGHWHLNDQDNSRTFQLRAVDVDPTTNQKTEVVETWSFTGSTTLQMVSGAQISGELTDQVMETLETPQIVITKVIGIKAI